MTDVYQKPLPKITVASAAYWDAAKKHELQLQRCDDCGEIFYPIAPHCLHCWAANYSWAKMSGRGRINAFTIYYQPFHEAYVEDVPYNVVEVELAEGPRIISNVTDVENDELHIGLPVEAWFDEVTPDITLVKFKPIR